MVHNWGHKKKVGKRTEKELKTKWALTVAVFRWRVLKTGHRVSQSSRDKDEPETLCKQGAGNKSPLLNCDPLQDPPSKGEVERKAVLCHKEMTRKHVHLSLDLDGKKKKSSVWEIRPTGLLSPVWGLIFSFFITTTKMRKSGPLCV